jgi:hypothetical protein
MQTPGEWRFAKATTKKPFSSFSNFIRQRLAFVDRKRVERGQSRQKRETFL